jgi:hypothetical protein
MALKKTLTTSAGISGEYWRCLEAMITENNGSNGFTIRGTVGLYLSKLARQSGKGYFLTQEHEISLDDHTLFELSGDAVELFYKALKDGVEFFNNAEDDI